MHQHISAGWLMRKSYHLLFALFTAVLFMLDEKSNRAWSVSFVGLMGMAIILLLGDSIFRFEVRKHFCDGVFKKSEDRKVSGITYGVCGIICAYLIGGSGVASASAVLLGVTDGVSGLAGVYIGRHTLPFNRQKSVEGTIVGCIAGLLVISVWPGELAMNMVMALTATVVEALPIPINDNFTVPVFIAIIAVGYKAIIS